MIDDKKLIEKYTTQEDFEIAETYASERVDKSIQDTTIDAFLAGIAYTRETIEHDVRIGRILNPYTDEMLVLLKQVLHARECNRPYGQMEKMPPIETLKRVIKAHE